MIKYYFSVLENDYPNGFKYNVQVWRDIYHDGDFYYSGIGKFCKTIEECENFKNSYRINHKFTEEEIAR